MQITLEFSDTVADIYRTRFAPGKGYTSTITIEGQEVPNPQSVDDFIAEKIHEWLCVECKSYERIARQAAIETADMKDFEAAIVEGTPVLKAKEDKRKADEAAAIAAIELAKEPQ